MSTRNSHSLASATSCDLLVHVSPSGGRGDRDRAHRQPAAKLMSSLQMFAAKEVAIARYRYMEVAKERAHKKTRSHAHPCQRCGAAARPRRTPPLAAAKLRPCPEAFGHGRHGLPP